MKEKKIIIYGLAIFLCVISLINFGISLNELSISYKSGGYNSLSSSMIYAPFIWGIIATFSSTIIVYFHSKERKSLFYNE